MCCVSVRKLSVVCGDLSVVSVVICVVGSGCSFIMVVVMILSVFLVLMNRLCRL